MYFYAKVLTAGWIRLSSEEIPDRTFKSYEEMRKYISPAAELIWGAGLGAENGAERPATLPLVKASQAPEALLKKAAKAWEYAANHPETREWATETYIKLQTELRNRF